MRIDYSRTVTAVQQPGYIPDPDRPGSSKWVENATVHERRGHLAYLRFDNWSELVRTAKDSPLNPNPKLRQSREYGGYDRAVQLATVGWSEGAERIRQIAAPFYEQLSRETPRPMPYFTEEGSAIDMARYLDGEPEAFIQWRESDALVTGKAKRHVRIAYNISASGGLAGKVFDRGGHLCALIDLLESLGRRVTVDLFDGVVGGEHSVNRVAGQNGVPHRRAIGGKQIYIRVQVKAPDEPLDMDRLAFALAHRDCLLGLVFAIEEALPEPFCKITYETPVDPPDLEDDADIVLTSQYLKDIPDMAEWVRTTLRQQGVEFPE